MLTKRPHGGVSFEDVDTWERLCGGPRKSVRDVRYGSLADIGERSRDVRFTPKSGHAQRQHGCPLSAKSGHSSSYEPSTSNLTSIAACGHRDRPSLLVLVCNSMQLHP